MISSLLVNYQNSKELFDSDEESQQFIDQKLALANASFKSLKILTLFLENEIAVDYDYFNRMEKVSLLENLQIKGYQPHEKQFKQFFSFLERQVHLKNLYVDLECTYSKEKNFQAELNKFCQNVANLKKLEQFSMIISGLESTNHFKNLSKSLKSLPNLQYLSLGFNEVTNAIVEINDFAEYIEQANNLKTLLIKFEEHNCSLVLKDVQELFQAIGQNRHIEDLSLSFSGYSGFQKILFQDLSKMINSKTNLKKFSINLDSLSEIKQDQFNKVLKSIENLKELESLAVNLNQIKISGDQIANLLKQQSQLTNLELYLNTIKINGQFQKINDELKNFKNLKRLVLEVSNNKLYTKTFTGQFEFLPKLNIDHFTLDISDDEGNYKEKFLLQIAKYIGQCSQLKSLKLSLQYYDAEEEFYSQLIKEISRLNYLNNLVVSDAIGEHVTNCIYKLLKHLVFYEMRY